MAKRMQYQVSNCGESDVTIEVALTQRAAEFLRSIAGKLNAARPDWAPRLVMVAL